MFESNDIKTLRFSFCFFFLIVGKLMIFIIKKQDKYKIGEKDFSPFLLSIEKSNQYLEKEIGAKRFKLYKRFINGLKIMKKDCKFNCFNFRNNGSI